jgi:hypothetical protein
MQWIAYWLIMPNLPIIMMWLIGGPALHSDMILTVS